MFLVSYNKNTGAIVNYSNDADDHNTPDGCETLSFASEIPGFLYASGTCAMKVDLEKKELVLINPQTIPKPIAG